MAPTTSTIASRSGNLAREWAGAQRNLLAFIGSLVHDFAEAEELLQETAAQIFEHVDRYDETRPFLPYAFGVARNVVLLHQRRSGRHPVLFTSEAIDRLAVAFEEIADEEDALRAALRECRETLPPRSRRLCRLRYEEGLASGEIARRMNSSPGTVRIWLFRIREQLKKCIQQRTSRTGGSHD